MPSLPRNTERSRRTSRQGFTLLCLALIAVMETWGTLQDYSGFGGIVTYFV